MAAACRLKAEPATPKARFQTKQGRTTKPKNARCRGSGAVSTPEDSRGVAGNDSAGGHIFGDHAARAHGRALSYCNPAKDRSARPNGRPALDGRWNARPIGLGLESTR